MTLQVNHINGDVANNDLPNLEVVPAPSVLCRHCAQPIEQTGDGEWIHASGFYSCFDAGYWKQATPKEGPQ
jgi:hypothetical protein